MDTYTREILDLLKDQYISVCGNHPFSNKSEEQSYWLKNYEDNLIHPMDAGAEKVYSEGCRSEIGTGRMGALKSSAALTYNLFWDQIAEIKHSDGRIGAGVYKVEFEKKIRTLRYIPFSAHLDAFLYCKHSRESVACEANMTEWMFTKPSNLCLAYLKPDNYRYSELGGTMVPLAKELIRQGAKPFECEGYPCMMERYDAFQMFKHVSSCYATCLNKDPGEIRKLTLVNIVWTLQTPSLLSAESQERYTTEKGILEEEFIHFKRIMDPVKRSFSDINVDFDVCLYTFSAFLALFEKTPEELEYLRRYVI